jgi:glycosyltransferase involved in cell wall biosynthesis
MPKVSAVVHVRDARQTLGRLLETLRPCDEIIVVDHSSSEQVAKVAREYGATVRKAVVGVEDGVYAADTKHEWVLCLRPNETLSEGLEAELFEWKDSEPVTVDSYALGIREQVGQGWRTCPPETRLVNRARLNWKDELPPSKRGTSRLEGDLLRFSDH